MRVAKGQRIANPLLMLRPAEMTSARSRQCGRWFHEIKICKSVGLGKTKFYKLLRVGKIKTITIGGRRLVPADEARRIVREGVQ